MSKISWLLSSTALIGIAGGTVAVAADIDFSVADPDPGTQAVSAPNAKLDARATTIDGLEAFAIVGSASAPVGQSFGFQADGLLGTVDDEFAASAAAHFFWRDPTIGLLGAYGEIGHVAAEGGITVSRAAVETELYVDRLTLAGLFGYQFGDAGEGFFSKESISYFATDDLRLFLSHSFLPDEGGHSGALGAEWLTPVGNNSVAFFGEGIYEEDGDWGASAGIRVYFGPQKSLIQRQREDDPPDHFDLFMKASSAGIIAAQNDEIVEE